MMPFSALERVLALVLLSPVLLYLVHIPVSRSFRGPPPQAVLTVLILLFQPATLALAWLLIRGSSPPGTQNILALAYALLVNLSTGYVYFFVFSMGETARRIRLLHEIRDSGVPSSYSEEDVLDTRLERLRELGQISFDGQRYRLRGKVLYRGALLVAAWRKILGLK